MVITTVVGGVVAGFVGTIFTKMAKDAADGFIYLYGPHWEYAKKKLWPRKSFKIDRRKNAA